MNKVMNLLVAFALLVNSMSPFLKEVSAFASEPPISFYQDVTPTPTSTLPSGEAVVDEITETPTPTETAIQEIQPSDTPALAETPTPEITATITETLEPSQTPTLEPSPTETTAPTETTVPTETATLEPTPTPVPATPTPIGLERSGDVAIQLSLSSLFFNLKDPTTLSWEITGLETVDLQNGLTGQIRMPEDVQPDREEDNKS